MRRESIQHATKKSNMKAVVEKMGDKNGVRHRKQVAKWQKPFLISNYLKVNGLFSNQEAEIGRTDE